MDDLPKSSEYLNQQSNSASSQDEGELWQHLHGKARSRYGPGAASRRSLMRSSLLIATALILLPSIWWLYNQINRVRGESFPAAIEFTPSAEETAALSSHNKTATAAKELNIRFQERATQRAATNSLIAGTATEQAQELVMNQAATDAAVATRWAEANDPGLICDRPESYAVEVVSGPHTSPRTGFHYIHGARPPAIRAVWTIENSGQCSWDQIALWSILEQKIMPPILQQAGNPVTPQASGGDALIKPGEQIDLVLAYTPEEAEDVKGEWTLIINDILLLDQPHITLEMENWVVTVKVTSTPTKKPRQPKTPEETPTPLSERPSEIPPPERPSEVPPASTGQ